MWRKLSGRGSPCGGPKGPACLPCPRSSSNFPTFLGADSTALGFWNLVSTVGGSSQLSVLAGRKALYSKNHVSLLSVLSTLPPPKILSSLYSAQHLGRIEYEQEMNSNKHALSAGLGFCGLYSPQCEADKLFCT